VARIFIILLIALLPLRGWAVDRMNIHMASGEPVASMPADCPLMIHLASADADSEQAVDSSHSTCQSCQLCMALTSQAPLDLIAFFGEPFRAACAQADSFSSAAVTRATKPPIL
jgi:hypothetical protein